jgi:hypothetical protein
MVMVGVLFEPMMFGPVHKIVLVGEFGVTEICVGLLIHVGAVITGMIVAPCPTTV